MQLGSPVTKMLRVNEAQGKALGRLGIVTLYDLLYHFPARYADIAKISRIADLVAGENATIVAKVTRAETKKGWKSKIPMGEAILEDPSGSIKGVWFHQAYIAKMLPIGGTVTLTGRIAEGKSGIYIANAEFDKSLDMPIDSHQSLFKDADHGALIGVYPESRGVSSRFIHHAIEKIILSGALDEVVDPIPEEILERYKLPKWKTAMIWLHMPRRARDAEAARKRFAFEEVFMIQLRKALDRAVIESLPAQKVIHDKETTDGFIENFGFPLTGAQEKAIKTIIQDFESGKPMSRLLEGDVGSGKTAVAATAAYIVATSRPNGKDFGNLQVAYMAPTEILATQHFESFIELFRGLPIQIGLLTGKSIRKFPSKVISMRDKNGKGTVGYTDISRTQLTKWVANGEIPILIGTHALIQKSVKFKHLALVIIDEQHRFGIKQRMALARKDDLAPHLLSMTATPIPRTLALTLYGDLDLTLLDESPKGRLPIITKIIRPDKREEVYEEVKKLLDEGRQLYVICPRINEPDPEKEMAVMAKSVTAEAERLEKIFPDYMIDILHSKMNPKQKESTMKAFATNETHILVATSVVEVGVNVPNATVIIIEGAERFGLAQLHQLRGRVMRSTHQPYCYLFSESSSTKTIERLQALVKAKNGFELSELDLKLRGSGELTGAKQWGITDLGMEAIKNIKMVEAARTEAKNIIEKNLLPHYPALEKVLSEKEGSVHFE